MMYVTCTYIYTELCWHFCLSSSIANRHILWRIFIIWMLDVMMTIHKIGLENTQLCGLQYKCRPQTISLTSWNDNDDFWIKLDVHLNEYESWRCYLIIVGSNFFFLNWSIKLLISGFRSMLLVLRKSGVFLKFITNKGVCSSSRNDFERLNERKLDRSTISYLI